MRTTLDINDSLLLKAKQRAARKKCSLRNVIEDALRLGLNIQEEKPGKKKRNLQIPTSGKGGLIPGVDLDDSANLLDIMEENE